MKLVIEIECDGQAIQCDPNALGDILRKTAEKLEDYETNQPCMGRIVDENGHSVGYYRRV